jgi:predicted permease
MQDDRGNASSMRKAFAVFIVLDVVLVTVMVASIIIALVRREFIDWTGLSYFLAAIGFSTSGAFGAKALQKKYERYD